MKTYNTLILFSFLSIIGCKHKQHVVTSVNAETSTIPVGKTKGVVSHKFKTMGCQTVVIINSDGVEVVLIPRTELDKKFNVDGKTIYFTYRKLRSPNPKGCLEGSPAELKDVE